MSVHAHLGLGVRRAAKVGEDDVGSLPACDARIEHLITRTARTPPITCAAMKSGAADGTIPAKVLENMRPIVMAGLAKLVELVKK